MTLFDDDPDMWEHAWADRLLTGEPVDGDGGLGELVAAVRATADAPAPAPSAALAVLLRDGLPDQGCSSRRVPTQVRAWGSRTVRATVAGVAASLAMGAGVATAAGGGGTPLDYVPGPVKRGVDAAVTAMADVLRSEPEAEPAAPAPASEEPVSTGGKRRADTSVPTSRGTTPKPAVSPAPSPSAQPTTAAPVPSASPSPSPAPTPTPEPQTSEPAPPLPSSGLPTPSTEPSPSPEPSPSESEPSPEPSESEGNGEVRKPLDNGPAPSPSPSPSPSSSPSPSPSSDPGPDLPAVGRRGPASAS